MKTIDFPACLYNSEYEEAGPLGRYWSVGLDLAREAPHDRLTRYNAIRMIVEGRFQSAANQVLQLLHWQKLVEEKLSKVPPEQQEEFIRDLKLALREKCKL